jgi:hypothetical protein
VAQFISNVLATFKSSAAELPPAVRFVPTSYLFTHAEPLPDGIQPSELDSFAEVTLEGLSPVPIEQLAWGYMADDKSRHMFIFAALRERLTADNLAPDESFYHILPSFFAAAPDQSATAHWVFIWESGHVAAVHYAAGEVIPSRIEVEMAAEDTPAGAFAAREHLLKRLGGNARHEAAAAVLTRPEGVRASRDRLSFWFASYASAEAEPVRIAGHPPASLATRWSSDLRGGQFRATEQKRRASAKMSTNVLKAAALVLIGLVCAQGYWGWMEFTINKTNNLLKDSTRTKTVDTIGKENELLATINKFTAYQLHPFEMIGVINEVRPPSVTYKTLKVTEATENKKTVAEVVATCQADNGSSSMNDYATFLGSLQNSGTVVVNGDPRPTQSYGGRVTFIISLIFPNDKIPPYEFPVPAAPPPKVETPPEDTSVEDAAAAAAAAAEATPSDATPPDAAPPPVDNGPVSIAPKVVGAPPPPEAPAPAPAATTDAPAPPATEAPTPPPAPGT